MTITLRSDQEKLIDQAIESGAYQHPHQVIERALEMLRSEEQWLTDHRDEIDQKIERAFGQFERGEFLSAEASKADMRQRKAEWRVGTSRAT